MTSLLGCHWIRVHPDGRDLDHIEKMQYKSVKLFEWSWSDRDFCRDLLTVLPSDSYILARDHPLSEQPIWSDPAGIGTRQANEWAMKVAMGQYHLPVERTFFLPANEPDATTGDRNAIDIYTSSFLDRLRVHGLRGGAFNFSTGHPRTVDGTPNTPADYSVFERSHQAIVRGHHIGVLHIYGTAAVPCAPGHYDRLKACDWQDVEWVVGEMGADEHVIGGGAHDGYLRSFSNPADYCRWLDTLILGINDPRIHSYQVFSYDFSHPWSSFDVREIRGALESYDWQHVKQTPTTPIPPPYVPTDAEVLSTPLRGFVTATVLNVRSGPSTDYPVVAQLAHGDAVTVTARAGNGAKWNQIGAERWVYSGWISFSSAPPPPAGDTWTRSIAFVRRWEGGWADDPNDPGGATNKGITIGTYTRWRAEHGQPVPTKEDLRAITDEEANKIFYEWYWLKSGADKLPWPQCLATFDLAVNGGVGRAQEAFAAVGHNNFLAYMAWRLEWYCRLDGFRHFGRAWARRVADLMRVGAE